jgi:thiomorpholine-carboxylate dehydrogenase
MMTFIFHSHLGVMPGYSSSDEALATKIVAFYPENKDLPTHQAWVLMQDPTNGSLNAVCY